MNQAFLSFNGGEISPYLHHRTDFEKHSSATARMENFLPMPYGSARKRPGTQHLAQLSENTRLEPFHLTDGSAYILAFTTTDLIIFDIAGVQKWTTPLTCAEPFKIQTVQLNDIVFIASSHFHPQQLSHTDATTWTLEDMPFEWRPAAEENTDLDHQIIVTTVDDIDIPGDEITLTQKNPSKTFPTDIVGSHLTLKRSRDEGAQQTLTLNPANDKTLTNNVLIGDKWEVNTYGPWKGIVTLQYSTDFGATWTNLFRIVADNDRTIAESGSVDSIRYMRLYWEDLGATGESRATLSSPDETIPFEVLISERVSDTQCKAICVTPVQTHLSLHWAYSAFSPRFGYPSCIAIHGRRLILGSTPTHPNSLWFSQIDDLLNFKTGTLDTDGIFFTLAATRQDSIRWIASHNHLIIGTESSEWVSRNGENDIITPSTLSLHRASALGSAPIPPVVIDSSLIFAQRSARRLRDYSYAYDSASYEGMDLTMLAEHITDTCITQLDFQTTREPTLWATRTDGTLLSFHYAKREGFSAWARHTTADGAFRSIAVLRTNTNDDRVFFVVERDGTFHLEKLAEDQQRLSEEKDIDHIHFVDSGVEKHDNQATFTTLTIPIHLVGKELRVIAGKKEHTLTATTTTLDLPEAVNHAHAGLKLASSLQTLPLDLFTKAGPTHSMKKKPDDLTIDVLNSAGGCLVFDGKERPFRELASSTFNQSLTLKSGWHSESIGAGHVRDFSLTICHDNATPFTLRSAVITWQQTESR